MKKRKITALMSAVLMAFLMISGIGGCKGKSEKKPSGAAAAIPFKLTTFDNQEFSLEAMKGKTVVVNFFASWCGPCRFEAKTLEKAYQAYKNDGVEFIAVAVDDTEAGAKGFIKEFNITFPAGRDAAGEIMKAYNIYGVPQTNIIGKDGAVSYTHSGAISEDILFREIKRAL
ncbi:MAG: TlpA family protein disulfide reductase [Deltaproteobacteria bacterium]|nr:TlpA family protein disulfide reductase [Deltaproteobacteria bacterium]